MVSSERYVFGVLLVVGLFFAAGSRGQSTTTMSLVGSLNMSLDMNSDADHSSSSGNATGHDMEHGNMTQGGMMNGSSTDHDMHGMNETHMDHDNSTDAHGMDHDSSSTSPGHHHGMGTTPGHGMGHGSTTHDHGMGHDSTTHDHGMGHGSTTHDHGMGHDSTTHDHGMGHGSTTHDHGTGHGTTTPGHHDHGGHTTTTSHDGHGEHGEQGASVDHSQHGGGSALHHVYFTYGNNVTLIFKEWITYDSRTMRIASVVTALVAIFYEGLKVLREHLLVQEKKYKRYQAKLYVFGEKKASCGDRCSNLVSPACFGLHLMQTVLHACAVFIGYCLMMVFMILNVWLVVGLIAGHTLGYLLFGWLRTAQMGRAEMSDHCNS